MGSTGGGTAKPPSGRPAGRQRPDRLAEALRANLKRRKAQVRARDEVRPGSSAPDADAPGRDG